MNKALDRREKDDHLKTRELFQTGLWSTAAVLLAVGCSRHESGSHHEAPEDLRQPMTVQTLAASLQTVEQVLEIPGTVESRSDAVLASKIQAQVAELLVRPGMRVEAGQLLLRMRAPELEARVASAEANVRQAELAFNRIAKLTETQAASQQDYDQAETALSAARGALQEARAFQAYLTVDAPFAGIVSEDFVDPGDLASPGTRLLSLYDPDHLWLAVGLPESQVERIEIGDTLGVRMDSAGLKTEGSVVEILPLADPVTRTITVRVALVPQTGIQPGAFGRLLLPVPSGEAVLVPAESIETAGQLSFCYVAEEGHAYRRLLRLGRTWDDSFEVLAGLRPGEPIVVPIPDRLTDGHPIIVSQ